MPSGFAELDAVLPGRGWPAGALDRDPARARRHRRNPAHAARARAPAGHRRDVVWIAPPHVPYAPALAAAGLDLARLVIVRCRSGARRAVGVRAGAARARMRRRVRVARRARRACAAAARGRRARRPHLGRAVAAPGPARNRDGRAAASRARAARAPARRARAEAPRRRSRAARADRRRRPWSQARFSSAVDDSPEPGAFSTELAMPTSPLAHHFYTMACNNAWSNHRLLAACSQLSQDDFVATRDELLSLDQGDAQPQSHRRLVLRRRDRAQLSAASRRISRPAASTNPRSRSTPARRCRRRSTRSIAGSSPRARR